MLKIMVVVLLSFILSQCTSSKLIVPNEAKPQSSVKIDLKDGSVREGIIFKGDTKQLIYVDADDHKTDTLAYAQIQQMSYLDRDLDFNGVVMSKSEIKTNQKPTKTILYGIGGLVLGAAAGTGVAIAAFAPKKDGDSGNSGAAIGTIAGFGTLGAVVFGWMGSKVDYNDAVFKTRKLHYIAEKKEMDKKKAELEQLKRQKSHK